MKNLLKIKLHWQILIAMLVGVLLGRILPPDSPVYSVIISLGTIFIRMLRMVIVPLIFTSIVTGVASIGQGKSIGRIGLKTMTYYLFTSLFAIMIGLTLTNLIQPGVGANIPTSPDFNPSSLQAPSSPADILIRMIPVNPIRAFAEGDMLGIIFFSIFLGFVITKLPEKNQNFLKTLFESGFDAMTRLTEIVIKLVPLGVLGLMTKAVRVAGFEMFEALSKYMVTVFLALLLHLCIVLPAIFFLTTRLNPLKHFRAMSEAMLLAFSTSSSNATLPVTISNVEKKAGVSNKISSFVLPLGATVNMDGTALYECAGVIFISQVLGLELTIMQQFVIVITALLASIGCAGIPSAGLVVIFIVTQAVGFKDVDVAVIIGTMLAVDRPLDMFRTMINVVSDSVGTVVIAKSEGETNLYPLQREEE